MSYIENVKALQRFAGTAQDGAFGPQTAAALVQKLALATAEPQPEKPFRQNLKVCLDPGHGMSNRLKGVFDPGCERGDLHEADIALVWANAIGRELTEMGVEVFFTRQDNQTHTPLSQRADRAESERCTVLVSIHVNDADSATATGTETLYASPFSERLAKRCQNAMLTGLALRDRGVKLRTDLAVLKFKGPAVLLELGFIGTDAATITNKSKIDATAKLLAAAIAKTAI